MSAVEIISVAASVSLLAGWRLYLCIFAVGLAMRQEWLAPPEHLQALGPLANGWVVGIAGTAAVVEFFVRPVGGALLALALIDASNPVWQVVILILGGGATILSHSAKAGTRAVVNTSPEPVSNVVVSGGEDVITGGALIATLANPVAAAIIALTLAVSSVALLSVLYRLLRRRPPPPPKAS